MQVTHTHKGQHGSLTQPENFVKEKQMTVLHDDHGNQCLELFFSSFLYVIRERRNLHRDSRHWRKCSLLVHLRDA